MNPIVKKTMSYRWFLSFILTMAYTALYAQTNTIKGRVVEPDGSSVMYATACVLNGGKVVAGALTDTVGVFTIKGRFGGDYALRVTCLGYNEAVRDITLGKARTFDCGNIILTSKATELNDVVVMGQVVEKKVTVEKTSITPSASVSAATGSLLDVLRGSPAVTIDGSGQVSIRGNGNVLILVDGVPTTLDGLGSSQRAEHRHRDQP